MQVMADPRICDRGKQSGGTVRAGESKFKSWKAKLAAGVIEDGRLSLQRSGKALSIPPTEIVVGEACLIP